MLRLLIGIITGVIAGGIASTFLSSIGTAIYHRPDNFLTFSTLEAMAWFEKMPDSVRWLSIGGVMLGSFVAGLVAAKIAFESRRRAAMFAGFGMLFFQTMALTMQIGQPWWYMLLVLSLPIPLAIFGGRLVKS